MKLILLLDSGIVFGHVSTDDDLRLIAGHHGTKNFRHFFELCLIELLLIA